MEQKGYAYEKLILQCKYEERYFYAQLDLDLTKREFTVVKTIPFVDLDVPLKIPFTVIEQKQKLDHPVAESIANKVKEFIGDGDQKLPEE